jgi:hypothetical protein
MEKIKSNFKKIISEIDEESVVVYEFLKSEFEKGKVLENPLFCFAFRAYYGLDNGGLSLDFKKKYFQIMDSETKLAFSDVLKELFEFENLKGNKSLQVSFTSKLIHTLDNSFPIYDSKVEKYMKWHYFPSDSTKSEAENFDVRVSEYSKRIEKLGNYYKAMIEFEKGYFLNEFDKKFKTQISAEKKIDFILWTAGKLGITI